MPIKTYYLTKYVITQGIIEFAGKLSACEKYVFEDYIFARVGKEAFESLIDAKADALERAVKNVASVTKALQTAEDTWLRMEKGDFVVTRRTD